MFVLVCYVFNYVFSFDCSCLFADRLSVFSISIRGIVGYFLLDIGRPTCGTNLSS